MFPLNDGDLFQSAASDDINMYKHNVHFKLNIPHACITMLLGISCLILIYKYSLEVIFR